MSVQISNPFGNIVPETHVKTLFTVDGCTVTLEGPLSVVSKLASQITSSCGDGRTFRNPFDGRSVPASPYSKDYLWNGPLTKNTPHHWSIPVAHD